MLIGAALERCEQTVQTRCSSKWVTVVLSVNEKRKFRTKNSAYSRGIRTRRHLSIRKRRGRNTGRNDESDIGIDRPESIGCRNWSGNGCTLPGAKWFRLIWRRCFRPRPWFRNYHCRTCRPRLRPAAPWWIVGSNGRSPQYEHQKTYL